MEIEKVINDIRQLNFVAIDLELANEKKTSICSIGIVEVKNGIINDAKEILIYPKELVFSDLNKKIHHITEEDVKYASEFDEAWKSIEYYFNDTILLAHNADFDIDALKQTAVLYNIALPELNYMCTWKLAAKAFKELKDYKLNDVAEYFNLEHKHHNSLSDSIICATIGILAIPTINIKEFTFMYEDLTSIFAKKPSENKQKFNFSFPEKINKDLLIPNFNDADSKHDFYRKIVVFTGVLKNYTDRNQACEIVKKFGADINTSISSKTNIVIIGDNAGPKKIDKINLLKEQGVDIRIIYEEEFISIIENSKL